MSLLNSVGGVGSMGAWVAWVRVFVSGMGQTLAWVAWVKILAQVAWVHTILTWVKKMAWVEILA